MAREEDVMGPRVPDGRGFANAAIALQAVFAFFVTLATLAFVALAPTLGGLSLGGGDGGGLEIPFSLSGLGFSPVDAVATVLGIVTILFWIWVILDVVYVAIPLSRRDLLAAEAPALLLGMLQTVFGGFLPGLFLIASSRRTREAIRQSPSIEAQRADTSYLPSAQGKDLSRLLGRFAMVGLGLLWGVAGISMFQNQFYLHLPALIQASSQGAPGFLSGWFHFWLFVTSFGTQPVVYIAGTVQLLLAFALIAGFARKTAYFVGLFAAVFLWIVPEAFGGPFVIGAFSLGPGPVYAVGLVALIALNATYGRDLATLDGAIERWLPGWARVAEVSVGLVPQIGQWYVRNAKRIARGCEVALGVLFGGSAVVAWVTGLGTQLGSLLASRSASSSGPLGSWFGFWGHLLSGYGPELATGIIVAECVLAVAFVFGVGRKAAYLAGLGLVLFIWSVVEGFGGVPGPGYTDPGVGIAEAMALLALLGIVAARGSESPTIDFLVQQRFPSWSRVAEFTPRRRPTS